VIPVGIVNASEVVVASTLTGRRPVAPVAEADAMASWLADSAAVTGHTVVSNTTVSVTTTVTELDTVVRGDAASTVRVVEPLVWEGTAVVVKVRGSAEETAVIEGDGSTMSPIPVAPVAWAFEMAAEEADWASLAGHTVVAIVIVSVTTMV